MTEFPLDPSHTLDREPDGCDTYMGESSENFWGPIYGRFMGAQSCSFLTRPHSI